MAWRIEIGLIRKAQYRCMRWNEIKLKRSEIDVIKFVKCGAIHHTFSAEVSAAARKFHIIIPIQWDRYGTCSIHALCVCVHTAHTWQTIEHHTPMSMSLSMDNFRVRILFQLYALCVIDRLFVRTRIARQNTWELTHFRESSARIRTQTRTPVHMLALCNNLFAWQIVYVLWGESTRNNKKTHTENKKKRKQ